MSNPLFNLPIKANSFTELQPSKLTEKKQDFAVKDRFTAHIFKELGWNEQLDFKSVGLDKFDDLLSKSTAMASISQALEQIKPIYEIFSKQENNQDALEKTKVQFSGYFFEELEKRIGVEIPKTLKQQFNVQNKAKNIEENLNPLEILQGFLEGTLSSFVKESLGDSIKERQEAVKLKVIGIFQKIWDINELLIQTLKSNQTYINQLRSESIQNTRLFDRALSKQLDDIMTLSSNDRFGTRVSILQQAISVKDQLRLAQDEYRKLAYQDKGLYLAPLFADFDRIANTITTELIDKERDDIEAIEANFIKISSVFHPKSDLHLVDYYINEFFLINDKDKEITKSKFFDSVRKSFQLGGYSSVNPAATDFIKKTKTRSDVFTEIDEAVPTNHTKAQPKSGALVDFVRNDVLDTSSSDKPSYAKSIGPLSEEAVTKLLEVVSDGKSYSFVSPNGFIGKYAFAASFLIEEKFLKPGTSGRGTATDSNWAGAKGSSDGSNISKRDDFFADTKLQDALIKIRLMQVYSSLMSSGILTATSPINEVGAAIATSYTFGLDAFKKLEKGGEVQDGLKASAKSYYTSAKAKIPNELPKNDITNSVLNMGGSNEDAVAALAGSNSSPAAMGQTFQMPIHAGASLYPHNQVKETESGHFSEFDDTPGSERINERHRTGTGYEIMPDGSRKVVVVGNGYRAVLGDDFIMISGTCNISVFGDANITSKGDVNINAGNDINLVAGGNLYMDVAGDVIGKISGNQLTNVDGNQINNVNGFISTNADGDVQVEGASVAMVAKDGNVVMAATKSASMSGGESASMASPGPVTMTSNDVAGVFGSQVALSSENSMDVIATVIAMDGDFISMASGSTIDANVKHAERAGGLGPAIPIASIAGSPSSKDGEAVKDEKFSENISKLETIDTASTQAYARSATAVARYGSN